jgi:DNA repair exonuclease SbcCD ATPase subunit
VTILKSLKSLRRRLAALLDPESAGLRSELRNCDEALDEALRINEAERRFSAEVVRERDRLRLALDEADQKNHRLVDQLNDLQLLIGEREKQLLADLDRARTALKTVHDLLQARRQQLERVGNLVRRGQGYVHILGYLARRGIWVGPHVLPDVPDSERSAALKEAAELQAQEFAYPPFEIRGLGGGDDA